MHYQVLRMMHRFSFHSYIHIRLHFNKSTLFLYSTIGAFLSTSDGSTRHIFFCPKYLSNYSNLFKRSDVRRPPPGTRSIFRSRPQHFAFALRQLRHDTHNDIIRVCVCVQLGRSNQKGNIVNYRSPYYYINNGTHTIQNFCFDSPRTNTNRKPNHQLCGTCRSAP